MPSSSFSYEDLGLTRESFERLVSLHTPSFFLDKKERYWPASVEWFLEHGALVERSQDGLVTILPRGSVSQEQLLAVEHECKERGENKRLALWLDEKDVCGPDPSKMDEDVPIYAFAKAVCDLQGVPVALEISYMALFTFNGAYPLWGIPFFLAGDHQGDWEHCTVSLKLPDFVMAGVWYNSHRNIEGEWAAAKDVPRDDRTGRIASFVARNGHGHYPRAGVVFRIFCAANDHMSAHGRVWRPSKVVRLCGVECGHCIPACTTRGSILPHPPPASPANTPNLFQQSLRGFPEVFEDRSVWQRWNGSWGTSQNPPRQCWFYNPEPPVSRTSFQRLCCPLASGVDTLVPQGRLRQAQERRMDEQVPHRPGSQGTLIRHVSKDASRDVPYETLVIARPLPGNDHTNPVSEAPEVTDMSRT